MKILLRGVSIDEMRELLVEELNLARHLSEKQARLHFGTIENQNAAMVKWWEFINQRLDSFVKMFELLDKSQIALNKLIELRLYKLEAMLREKEGVLTH
mgnify:FL=1